IALAEEVAAGITVADYKISAYRSIASAQAEVGCPMKAWICLATAYQEKPWLSDLQGSLKSLKSVNHEHVAFQLIYTATDMAEALKELQDNEVKWQELRARSTQ
ncbi:MAG: hypothetical protein NOU37_07400, partial [Candidatus Brocadiales bacterium]|nr:hypothetical protein [Candidatus Bathyanammoxibius amoris]